MDITELPNDIFLLIISYLDPKDCVLSRRVGHKWREAFTNSELCRHMLKSYPRAREVRLSLRGDEVDWSHVLGRVSARYHFLRAGKPRCIEKLPLGKSFVVPQWRYIPQTRETVMSVLMVDSRHHGVATWQRHLQFEEKTAPFHYPDTLWTYDEGLLVFP